MISVRDAQAHILDRITAAAAPELLPLAAALGRVLADDVRAEMDVPPTDNSAVDGYAVASSDIPGTGTRALEIVADPSTPLLAAYAAWTKVYAELADGHGARIRTRLDWSPAEKDMLPVIELEKLLAVERAPEERGP